MRLTGQVVSAASVGARERAEMFALMQAHYDGADRETFDRDLDEKDWVIQIIDERTCRLKGFSTQMLLEVEVAGRLIYALFSGDTIVHNDARGERTLLRGAGWLVRSLIDERPGAELYWFLISKGYKTYRFLPVFFNEFYPRYDVPTPPRFASVIDALARHKFRESYDGRAGIVRAAADACRLRPGVADVTEDRLRDPHVRFFADRNPRHARGDELCCLAPLRLANLSRAAHRAMGDRSMTEAIRS